MAAGLDSFFRLGINGGTDCGDRSGVFIHLRTGQYDLRAKIGRLMA